MSGQRRLQDQLVACLKSSLAGGRPVIPEGGSVLWNCFVELSDARSGNGLGPDPISWADLEAWMRIKRWPLSDAHIAILRAMDRAWLDHAYSRMGKDKQKDGKTFDGRRAANAPALTAAGFDAVFG